jgi:hypothetical protein
MFAKSALAFTTQAGWNNPPQGVGNETLVTVAVLLYGPGAVFVRNGVAGWLITDIRPSSVSTSAASAYPVLVPDTTAAFAGTA